MVLSPVITTWYKMGLYHHLTTSGFLFFFFLNSKVRFTEKKICFPALWINYGTKLPTSHLPLSLIFHILCGGSSHETTCFALDTTCHKKAGKINNRDSNSRASVKRSYVNRWLTGSQVTRLHLQGLPPLLSKRSQSVPLVTDFLAPIVDVHGVMIV